MVRFLILFMVLCLNLGGCVTTKPAPASMEHKLAVILSSLEDNKQKMVRSKLNELSEEVGEERYTIDGDDVGIAIHWLSGFLYFKDEDYRSAIEDFDFVIQNFNQRIKVVKNDDFKNLEDSLLLSGVAYAKLGDQTEANRRYARLFVSDGVDYRSPETKRTHVALGIEYKPIQKGVPIILQFYCDLARDSTEEVGKVMGQDVLDEYAKFGMIPIECR